MSGCPFCEKRSAGEALAENELAFAVRDGFPVTPGHTLVLPIRHVPDYFDLASGEKAAVCELVDRVRRDLVDEHGADGINLGVNAGEAAGQTVFHAHVHVIPRYAGDCEDPRGGVRWIRPAQAPYWKEDRAGG